MTKETIFGYDCDAFMELLETIQKECYGMTISSIIDRYFKKLTNKEKATLCCICSVAVEMRIHQSETQASDIEKLEEEVERLRMESQQISKFISSVPTHEDTIQ